MKRRSFLAAAGTVFAEAGVANPAQTSRRQVEPDAHGSNPPPRIPNEYSLLLRGEREALSAEISVSRCENHSATVQVGDVKKLLRTGEELNGWQLKAVTSMNGTSTAVLEKQVTHRGMLVMATENEGVILRIPKGIGSLASIRPRPTAGSPNVRFTRKTPYLAGPDVSGNSIINSDEDPCYENVAALGAEYIGYTLVANEQAGPLRSLFLEADGKSRESASQLENQASWAPDLLGRLFEPSRFLPGEEPSLYRYLPGWSKRTLLGGYLPVAHIGVWNPETHAGYEVLVVLPPGAEAQPIGRIRATIPQSTIEHRAAEHPATRSSDGLFYVERYWNTSAEHFYSALAGVANYWQHFFDDQMSVDIPDQWLLDAARAGITLARCSYRGLEPSYQIGQGAYTKIPERSHALFPVSFYEYIWAHQLWNLTGEAEPYFQNYLDRYILPDGNFLYNTQDQVEGPLNVGVFLWNSARSYDYTGDLDALKKRLPALRRMIDYVLLRYEYSKTAFPVTDRRHGLIWGSPEADLGDPDNDFPNSHPYYFQNSAWIWRGLKEHARCLELAGRQHSDQNLSEQASRLSATVTEMRAFVERSLQQTLNACDAEMRHTGITPFSPDDIHHNPRQLSSYENHRFMMDWFTADWGDPKLDLGHLKHRELAGQQVMGLHTDGDVSRTSNFMAHGTLSVGIRQEDYRPFLLTLYSLCCYAADSGNRYAPEDAYLPGGSPGEGNPYFWSSVVNSVLQPTLGLRWLLCYEESDRDVCHLQKAAPKHWFGGGQQIRVAKCPTRFGLVSWTTKADGDHSWQISIDIPNGFAADLIVHIHPPDGRSPKETTAGSIQKNKVVLSREFLAQKKTLVFTAG